MRFLLLFSLLKKFRQTAEALHHLAAELSREGNRPYPRATWQVPSQVTEGEVLAALQNLESTAEQLFQALNEPKGKAVTDLVSKTRAFLDLCTALQRRISHPLPEPLLDAPYGSSAPRIVPTAVSALMVAEAASRLANEVTSRLLWRVNVLSDRDMDP